MNRTRMLSALCAALLAVFALTGPLAAQEQGRAQVTVSDLDGKPIQGAKGTLTSPDFKFSQEKTTDKKGQMTFMILDTTRDYKLKIEAEGFQPMEQPIDPQASATIKPTFMLAPSQPAAPAEQPPAEEQPPALTQAAMTYNEGVEAFNSGDKNTAYTKFEAAVQLDPNLIQAQSALAGLYIDRKEWAKAAAAAEKVLAAEPTNVEALRDRYDAYKGLGDKAKAEEALKALSTTDVGNRDTAVRIFNEGVGAFNAGNLTEAKATFERAVTVDPTLPKAYYMLGLVSISTDDQAKAKQYLQKFLELAPDDKDAATAKEMLESLK